jgi:hypothetical protein
VALVGSIAIVARGGDADEAADARRAIP